MSTFAKATFNANAYRSFRPEYSPAFYKALLGYHKGARDTAIDVGTGTLQVANAVAKHFAVVNATDPSEAMKSASANLPPNVTVRVASAESLPFPDASADIVVAGQAAHWFNLPKFYAEAHRVLKPNGTVAVWSYGFCSFPKHPRVSEMFRDFAVGEEPGQLGPYWEPGRQIVDEKYPGFEDVARTAGFQDLERWDYPGKEGALIERNFSVNTFQAYLKTWSAYKNYMDKHPQAADPVDAFIERLMEQKNEFLETMLAGMAIPLVADPADALIDGVMEQEKDELASRDELLETIWSGVAILARKK
ncbi:hypothetical protein HDU86_001645 [Geranomyces michiganensis]|nr:hypothetical protein HDU86_001645 [Geranomyces michiganensis]